MCRRGLMQSPTTKKLVRVTLRFHQASEPMVFTVANAYTKGPLYCLRNEDNSTTKFPLVGIFSIHEDGGFSTQDKS